MRSCWRVFQRPELCDLRLLRVDPFILRADNRERGRRPLDEARRPRP